jgi:hypothetical protein
MLEQLEAPSGQVYGVLKAFGLLKSLEGGIAEYLDDETLDVLMSLSAKAANTVEQMTEDIVKTALSDGDDKAFGGKSIRNLTKAQAAEQIGLVEKVLFQVNGMFIADEVKKIDIASGWTEDRAIHQFVHTGFWGEKWKGLPDVIAHGLDAEDGMFIMEDIKGTIAKIQSGRSRKGESRTSSKRGSVEVEISSAPPPPAT